MKTKAQKRELIKQVSTEDLQSELTNRGYYAERLWHTDDVDPYMPHEEAMSILEVALTNGPIESQVRHSISSLINSRLSNQAEQQMKCFVGYDELK
jgi:hypothetical protein